MPRAKRQGGCSAFRYACRVLKDDSMTWHRHRGFNSNMLFFLFTILDVNECNKKKKLAKRHQPNVTTVSCKLAYHWC